MYILFFEMIEITNTFYDVMLRLSVFIWGSNLADSDRGTKRCVSEIQSS